MTNPPPSQTSRASRAARGQGRVRNEQARQAELIARLTARDRWLLAMLAEHRVLTTTQLVPLAFPSARAAQLRLRALHQLGVIDRFQPLTTTGSAPLHWVLDTPGAAVLAAEHALTDHPDPSQQPGQRRSRRADRHRRRRGEALAVAHSNQLRHLLGVNTCLTSLAATAVGDPEHLALELWWSQARCTRWFGDFTRPDAYAHWRQNGTRLAFFLEYDRGSEPPRQLAAKLDGYHQLAAATATTTPVLFWLPTPARETTARRALADALGTLPTPDLVPVATTHANPQLNWSTLASAPDPVTRSLGLAGPVWLPLQPLSADHRAYPCAATPSAPPEQHDPPPAMSPMTATVPPPRAGHQGGGRTTPAGLAALWWPRTGPHQHTDEPTSPPGIHPTHGVGSRPGRHNGPDNTHDIDAPTPMPPPAAAHPAHRR